MIRPSVITAAVATATVATCLAACATGQPTLGRPALDQPALDQPALDQPALDQPALDQPAPTARSGNPILAGWYADPEAHVFEGRYWIYPTYSAPYGEQTFLDAFSSPDLVTWTRHAHVRDTANVRWARRAVWAPSIVEQDGWYYLFFGANDIQNDRAVGGIGVARARTPTGPSQRPASEPTRCIRRSAAANRARTRAYARRGCAAVVRPACNGHG